MARVPSIAPKRDKEIARLRKLLAGINRIPAHCREDELAEVRAEGIRKLLAHLEKH